MKQAKEEWNNMVVIPSVGHTKFRVKKSAQLFRERINMKQA